MSAFRATRFLLERAPESPHTYFYHEGKTPFWRKFREYFSLNPDIASGLPKPLLNRYPQPASRPEKPLAVASQASDPAANLYHNRDFRRKYPQTHMITQGVLTRLLLAEPNEDGTKSLPNPTEANTTTTALTRPADLEAPTAFTDVVAQVHKEPQFAYSAKNMPPRFPSKPSHHILHKVPGAIPHNRFDYFPVDNYN